MERQLDNPPIFFMKAIIITLILSLFLSSCSDKAALDKYDKDGNLIVYNEMVYAEMWSKDRNLKVTVIDTFCINEKLRAVEDIKKGKLIYFDFHPLGEQKFSKLLSRYGIEFKEHLRRDVRLGGFEPYCYQNEMYREINRKFGEGFIDSLSEVAKKEYVQENPDVEYMEDGQDLRDKYNVKQ